MSDLISRSEAIQRFIQETVDSKSRLIHINTIKRLLQDVESAYNVDKVIEELYEERTKILLSNDYECEIINYCLDNFDNAINIVKQGGVSDASDNVCEWKLDDDNLITSCDDYFNLYDNCTEKFKYCPRCGKKIKVIQNDNKAI